MNAQVEKRLCKCVFWLAVEKEEEENAPKAAKLRVKCQGEKRLGGVVFGEGKGEEEEGQMKSEETPPHVTTEHP